MIFFLYIFCQIFPGGSPEPRGMYGVGWTKETTFHQLWHLCIRKSFYSEYLATYLKISLDFAFEQSKYVFTFRLDHSANEGTGFLWTIFHAQDTTNPSHAKISLQNKFPPKLHLQLVLDGGFSDRRSYWSVFVGDALLPKLLLDDCQISPPSSLIFSSLLRHWFGFWSRVSIL